MMVKILYNISFLMLICAGLVFGMCGVSTLPCFLQSRGNKEVSIIEKFRKLNEETQSSQDKVFPLVQNAAEFALYLNPIIYSESHISSEKIINTPSVQQSKRITSSFKLLSTSYYVSVPENSLALIAIPGSDAVWMMKGERFGNFIIEKIENGVITYKDGNGLYKMSISSMETVQTTQVQYPAEQPLVEKSDTSYIPSSQKSNQTRERIISTSESTINIYKE